LGLLSQAKGHHRRALALATAASFTKPSMGYLYGLVLLLLMVLDPRVPEAAAEGMAGAPDAGTTCLMAVPASRALRGSSERFSAHLLSLRPAICTALGLYFLLSLSFGWKSVLFSLLPFTGMRAYKALHFGWTGVARQLLYFPRVKPGYYVGTALGFWGI